VHVADAQSYQEMGFPRPIAAAAAAGTQPFVEQAHARGGEFHGPLTRPDAAQLAEIVAIIGRDLGHRGGNIRTQ
jgi:hypothetical protein